MLGIRMRRAVEARKGVKGLGFRRVSGLEESADRDEGEKKVESKVEIEGANADPGGASDDKLASSLFDELSAVFKSVKEVTTDSKQSRRQLPARRIPVAQNPDVAKPATLQELRSRLKQLFETHKYYECLMTFTKLLPNERKELAVDRACFLYAIAAGAKADYPRTCLKFLEEMETKGLETDHTIYHAAMLGVELACAPLAEGTYLLERMKHRGIAPTLEIYNSLLRVHANRAKTQQASDVLDDMRQAGIEPNQDSMVALVNVAIRTNQLHEALDWTKKMESEFGAVPAAVWFDLLGSLANNYQFFHLAETWAEYQQARSGDAPPLPIGVYVAMFRCGARFWAADFCLDMLKQLRKDHPEHVPNDAYYGAINACGLRGRFEEAFDLLATMSAEGRVPRTSELNGLVDGLATAVEEVDRGYYVLEGRHASGKKVYLPELNAILAACAQLGDTERTTQTFEETVRNFALQPTVETYEILLRMADRSGQLSRISTLIAEMQQRGLKPTKTALQTLAWALVKKGKESEAIAMLQNGLKSGLTPSYGVMTLLERRYSAQRKVGAARIAKGYPWDQKRLDDWGRSLMELMGSVPSVRVKSYDQPGGIGVPDHKPIRNRQDWRNIKYNQNYHNFKNWGDVRTKVVNRDRTRTRMERKGARTPAGGPTGADVPTDGAVKGGALTGGAADLAGSPGSDSFANELIERGDLLDEMIGQVEAQQGADAAAAAEEPGKGSGHEEEAAGSAESVQVQGAEAVDEAKDSVAEGPSATAKTKPKRAAKSKKRGAQEDGADLQQESATP